MTFRKLRARRDSRLASVVIMGSGRMGTGVAVDLEKDSKIEKITVVDTNQSSLDKAKAKARTSKIRTVKADVTDPSNVGLLREFDVGIGALPHPASPPALRTAIAAGLSVVDMVFEPEQWDLDADAKKAGVTIIPGFGLHPGLANVFAGHGCNGLEKVTSVIVRCGGLPVNAKSPLNHRTAFNIFSAVGEYVKEAEIIEDGKIKKVPPMTEIEKIHHPKLGEVEAFITGTSATLTKTLAHAKVLKSKTVRWPGNVESMKLLSDCGLLSRKDTIIQGVKTTPLETFVLLAQHVMLLEEGEKDLSYLNVEVEGYVGNLLKKRMYELLDYYDEKEGLTSMQRSTGFPPAIAARMILNGQITEKGVVPPEKLFTGEKFEYLMKELSRRGISIDTRETSVEERKY
jgi:lysine 6-dehydrogenase